MCNDRGLIVSLLVRALEQTIGISLVQGRYRNNNFHISKCCLLSVVDCK